MANLTITRGVGGGGVGGCCGAMQLNWPMPCRSLTLAMMIASLWLTGGNQSQHETSHLHKYSIHTWHGGIVQMVTQAVQYNEKLKMSNGLQQQNSEWTEGWEV